MPPVKHRPAQGPDGRGAATSRATIRPVLVALYAPNVAVSVHHRTAWHPANSPRWPSP